METYAAVDGLGARGVSFGGLPAPIEGLLRPHVINQEMTVEAGLKGDKELAFKAIVRPKGLPPSWGKASVRGSVRGTRATPAPVLRGTAAGLWSVDITAGRPFLCRF